MWRPPHPPFIRNGSFMHSWATQKQMLHYFLVPWYKCIIGLCIIISHPHLWDDFSDKETQRRPVKSLFNDMISGYCQAQVQTPVPSPKSSKFKFRDGGIMIFLKFLAPTGTLTLSESLWLSHVSVLYIIIRLEEQRYLISPDLCPQSSLLVSSPYDLSHVWSLSLSGHQAYCILYTNR